MHKNNKEALYFKQLSMLPLDDIKSNFLTNMTLTIVKVYIGVKIGQDLAARNKITRHHFTIGGEGYLLCRLRELSLNKKRLKMEKKRKPRVEIRTLSRLRSIFGLTFR